MRSIFNFILFLSISSYVHSASDLDRWNSQSGKTVRAQTSEQLAQTTYRDISSTPKEKSNINRVYPEIELKAKTPEGRSRVVADAVLDTNKDAVKRDWKKNLKDVAKGNLKGGAAGIALGYGVDRILDAMDWILDPDNNQLQRKPKPEEEDLTAYPNIYRYSGGVPCAQFISNPQSQFSCVNAFTQSQGYRVTGNSISNPAPGITSVVSSHSGGGSYQSQYTYQTNPNYNPQSELVTSVPLTDNEIDNAVDDIIDNAANDPKKKAAADAMAKSSYGRIWDDKGNLLEIGAEIKDATDDILKDDDPKSSGKTEETPKINIPNESESTVKPDNDTNKEYLEDDQGNVVRDPQGQPVKNPNYNPNEKPSYSIKTEYPIFCDWASIVCDWIDWTRDEDDLPEKDTSDLTVEIQYEKKEYTVKWLENCPSPVYETFSIGGQSKNVKIIDYQFICQAGDMMKPWVISFATLAGLFIILGYHSRSE